MIENSLYVVTAHFAPFKLITKNASEEPWSITIEQVNSNDYGREKLGEVIGSIDIGINPYSMLITRDGGLLLPCIIDYSSITKALVIFNEFLVCLFLGGEYCEAIGADDVSTAWLNKENLRISTQSISRGSISKFQAIARTPFLAEIDRVKLMDSPFISLNDLIEKYTKGKEILNQVDMSLEQVLFGATFYTRRNLSESLIHFWTVFERMLEKVWDKYVVNVETGKKRKEFLKDSRTWTAATKLEVLYQKQLIDIEFRIGIDELRRARNKLAHEGDVPSIELLNSAIKHVFKFLSLILSNFKCKDDYNHLIDLLINRDFFDGLESNKQHFIGGEWVELLNKDNKISVVKVK